MSKSLFLSLLAIIFLQACGSSIDEDYRMNKKYWDADDYRNAVYQVNFTKEDEKKPSLDSPEKSAIFKRLVDKENIKVVVDDEELGLRHRNEFISEIFSQYRNLVEYYFELDREDKFIYPLELVEVLKFGLFVNERYFDIGNRTIEQNADNPNSSRALQTLKSNVQTLVGNYSLYLDYIKYEDSFSPEAISSYANGINEYFPKLVNKYPEANYHKLQRKAENMLNKTGKTEIKASLNRLISVIEDNHG